LSFFERRSIKRVQAELGPSLAADETISGFDFGTPFGFLATPTCERIHFTEPIQLAISNYHLWIGIPATPRNLGYLFKFPWDEVLEFRKETSDRIRSYEISIADGHRFGVPVRLHGQIAERASALIVDAESRMPPEVIQQRREVVSTMNDAAKLPHATVLPPWSHQ
jgi:hypothetical protein